MMVPISLLVLTISTHTLTWSVTKKLSGDEYVLVISTHTLTWSVTTFVRYVFGLTTDFNSHAHVERDAPIGCDIRPVEQFQLTRSRGA